MKNINEVKEYISKQWKWLIALDIDETLSNTIITWIIEMQKEFWNPEWLTPFEMAKKYKHSSNIPYWQEEKHLKWQHSKIICNEFQKNIPVMNKAKETVKELNKTKKIGLYITIRPQCVLDWSYEWLKKHGFPDVPIYARPENIEHKDWNKWKAEVLQELYPYIDSIVDDNPQVCHHLPEDYKWKFYLLWHDEIGKKKNHTILCKTWNDVTNKIKKI